MSTYLSLPFALIHFWFVEAPWMIVQYFGSVNASYLRITSLQLLVRTFFMPVKNEYRKGLVGFSIGMGIVLKTMVIGVSLLGLMILLGIEGVLLTGFICAPILSVMILFK